MAADVAIVGYVHIGHNPVVVTDRGDTAILNGAPTDRAPFSERVAVANDKAGRLTGVLLVLRLVADRRELVDVVVFANRRRPANDDMAFNF